MKKLIITKIVFLAALLAICFAYVQHNKVDVIHTGQFGGTDRYYWVKGGDTTYCHTLGDLADLGGKWVSNSK